MSEATDWKARAELLESRFREMRSNMETRIAETVNERDAYLTRALDAEKKLAKVRSTVATFLEGLDGLRQLP